MSDTFYDVLKHKNYKASKLRQYMYVNEISAYDYDERATTICLQNNKVSNLKVLVEAGFVLPRNCWDLAISDNTDDIQMMQVLADYANLTVQLISVNTFDMLMQNHMMYHDTLAMLIECSIKVREEIDE